MYLVYVGKHHTVKKSAQNLHTHCRNCSRACKQLSAFTIPCSNVTSQIGVVVMMSALFHVIFFGPHTHILLVIMAIQMKMVLILGELHVLSSKYMHK